ncbi:class I SAM-dependent methyltransferase [Litorivicinus sp.]|nr:class I SAM-dependent methyltransferase [Litorivicinus sp.]
MWDERYQTPEYIFGDQPCQWLIMNQHRLTHSGKALALGDGEGRNGVFLAELGFEVTSVDLSEVGLSKARDLASKRGVTIQTVQADLEYYEIEAESQDLIVSIYCHLPDAIRKLVHERAEVALKPGGLFILEAFHHSQLKYQSGGPKTTDLLYGLDALLDDFQTLQILEAFDGLCYLDEGARHSGIGHIVRLVLQKPTQ